MANKIYLRIILPLLALVVQGCQCSSRPDPDYAPFPIEGWGEKYFTLGDKPIESKKWAYYYRKAYYRNGQPDPDSLAVDYYLTGEKKDQGYLLSENPVQYNGERIHYFPEGALEKQYYKNGIPTGEWLFYLEDGSLSSRTFYKDGVRQYFIQYDQDGKKNRYGIYKDGVFYQDIQYYPNGRTKRISTYDINSNQDSYTSIAYYESGKVKFKAKFVKAPDFATSHTYVTTGDVYKYDENGHLTITNNDPKPIKPKANTNTYNTTKRKTPSTWDRGYHYGWSVGYQDGIDGNDVWYSYDDSRKDGDFLNGYTSGYEDGYANGREERRENNDVNEEEEDY